MVSSIRSFFSSSANSFFFKEQDSSVDELFGLIGKIRHEGINDKNLSSVLTKKEVCIRNARGNCFSRFILKKFFSAKIKLRNAKIAVAKNEIKELTKFHSIGLKNTSLSGKKFLKDLLIENHLFERMHKFGHKFQFSHDGTPVFQFQRMDSLREEIVDDDDLKDDIADFSDEIRGEGVILREKGEFEDGRFHDHNIDQLSNDEILKLLVREGESNVDSFDVVYPIAFLNKEQLVDEGIVIEEETEDLSKEDAENSTSYLLSDDYQYLENGFVRQPPEIWRVMRPYKHVENPKGQFVLDIFADGSVNGLGVFSGQGHASIELTTPNGEVSSCGLYPNDTEVDLYDFSLQKGVLISPEPCRFKPKHAQKSFKTSYVLPNHEAYHKLMKRIETLQGTYETEEGETIGCNTFYQATHHNCATFANEIRTYAEELGAKHISSSETRSTISKIWTKIKKSFLNFALIAPFKRRSFKIDRGIDIDGYEFNVWDLKPKGLFLPIDLIR
jgi:hypothetical protein